MPDSLRRRTATWAARLLSASLETRWSVDLSVAAVAGCVLAVVALSVFLPMGLAETWRVYSGWVVAFYAAVTVLDMIVEAVG